MFTVILCRIFIEIDLEGLFLIVSSRNVFSTLTLKHFTISVQNRFADRKLVCPVKLEEAAGDGSSEETADDMIESLSLEATDENQPSSSRVTMKSFQSHSLKKGDARGKKKRATKKKYI